MWIGFNLIYTHVQYSVGAVYLAILNFPRHLRYKRENMLLVGVIPGPHEPSLHINSFLEPVVDELLRCRNDHHRRTAGCTGSSSVQLF